MANNRYFESEVKATTSKRLSIPIAEVNMFFDRHQIKAKKIIQSCLDSLASRNLLQYEKVYYVAEELNGQEIHRKAKALEAKTILQIKRNILNQWKYEFEYQVYVHRRNEEFYDLVREQLKKKTGLRYSYTKLEIIWLPEELTAFRGQMKIELQKQLLNEAFCNALDKEAETKYKNNQVKIESTGKIEASLPEGYVENQRALAKFLVKNR